MSGFPTKVDEDYVIIVASVMMWLTKRRIGQLVDPRPDWKACLPHLRDYWDKTRDSAPGFYCDEMEIGSKVIEALRQVGAIR